MPDLQKLEEFSPADLIEEMRARESQAKSAAGAATAPVNKALEEFDSASILTVLTGKQKVIYGVDDRADVFQVADQALLDDVDSVVALFSAAAVRDNGDGTSTLATENFGVARNLCAGERFRDQPLGAFCSGFLVAPDIVATAGHCVNSGNVTDVRFVFGFRMLNAGTARTVVSNDEIYRGATVIGRQEVGDGPDWALVQLDRVVTNHRLARMRRSGRIPNGQTLHVIGHPVGLPTKVAGGATVRDNAPGAFFVANLDTYGGNSGSPVFNSRTHEVEGILVRGETDFVARGNCTVSLVCPTTGCRGEDSTRTTEFAQLVPPVSIFKIVSRSSGKVLDVPGFATADKTPIEQFTDNGGVNQQWRLVPVGDGFFKIVSRFNGKVLDVPGFATADKVRIEQFTDNGGTNQQWQLVLVEADSGFYKIVSRSSGKVLDVPAFATDDKIVIEQFTDNGGDNQHWRLVAVNA